jgi:hypothetical protein
MAHHRLASLASAGLLLLAVPAALGEEGDAPTLGGSFDQATQLLALSWTPSAATPEGSTFSVYLNGELVTTTSELQISVDLAGWDEGVREYQVQARFPSGDVTGLSAPFRILKDVQVPSDCPVASISIYTQPPGAEYAVYPECLPG